MEDFDNVTLCWCDECQVLSEHVEEDKEDLEGYLLQCTLCGEEHFEDYEATYEDACPNDQLGSYYE